MASITVFEDDSFKGLKAIFTGEISDLKDQRRGDGDWGDQISSLVVESGTWVLYEKDGFDGDTWEVSADGGRNGSGEYPDPKYWKGSHDNISSIRPIPSSAK